MPSLFVHPSSPTSRPNTGTPLVSAPSLAAAPATSCRVLILHPPAPQARRRTLRPVCRNPSTVASTAATSRVPRRLHSSRTGSSILGLLHPTISTPTGTGTSLTCLSSPSSVTPTTITPSPSSSLSCPVLSSGTTSSLSSPTSMPIPKVTYAQQQARKLMRSVRRMHAQISVAKLSVLDESVRRDVACLKRKVIGFLNTAEEVYFYLKASDGGWAFDADFSPMAMVTGKWFKLWRGVRKELESRKKEKRKRDESEDEGDDFDGPS